MFGIPSDTLNVLLNIVAVLFGGGIFGVVLNYRRGMRQLLVEEKKNTQELLNADKKDLRDHYDQELERLASRVTAAEDKHLACEERENENRKRIRDLEEEVRILEDEVAGLKRQIVRYSATQVVLLEESEVAERERPSKLVAGAAKRVAKITQGPRMHDPQQTDLRNAAEDVVHDQRQALQTGKDACEEVKRQEGDEGEGC